MNTSGNIGPQSLRRPPFYDYERCSSDISGLVHWDEASIEQAVDFLDEESSKLVKILKSNYKKVAIAEGDTEVENSKVITKGILSSLYSCFIEDCLNLRGEDFDFVSFQAKTWADNTIMCIRIAFSDDVLPDSSFSFKGSGEPYYPDSWLKCDNFRKEITGYCISLVVHTFSNAPYNPYVDAHRVVPFNYYGADYHNVVDSAKQKKLKAAKYKKAIDYLANYEAFPHYLEENLSVFKSKDINDKSAESERGRFVTDMVDMASSYLEHLEEEGVTDKPVLRYAVELWDWMVHKTMDYTIDEKFLDRYLNLVESDCLEVEDDLQKLRNTIQQETFFKELFYKELSLAKVEYVRDGVFNESDDSDDSDIVTAHSALQDSDNSACNMQTPQKGKTRIPFSECILISNDKEKLTTILHSMLEGKTGISAYKIMYAAIRGGLISKPSYNAVTEEFGCLGAQSGYNNFMSNKQSLPAEEIDPIVLRIKQEMEKLR